MNSVVKIFSHIRSGTHLLAHLLAKNFYEGEDLSTGPGVWGHWQDRQDSRASPVGRLFGHHLDPPADHLPAIYLVRDGRDVLVSLWRTKHFLAPALADATFSEFLRTRMNWIWSPSVPSKPRWTAAKNWYEHVRRWLAVVEAHPEIILLTYEGLVHNSDASMALVQAKLGLEPTNDHFQPVGGLVGIAPNAGRVGAWREHFDGLDREFFYETVPEPFMQRLGYA